MSVPWQIRLYRRSIKKRETMAAVMDSLPPLAGKRCLEIGCATGTSSWLLRQRGGEWTSTDFEAEQVASASRLLNDDVLLLQPDEPLPFPDASFDVVVGINFLEHLENDVEFVREMVRVLKPGGTLVQTCPDGVSSRAGYRLKQLYGFTASTGGFGHVRDGYRPEELEELFRKAGLEMEGMQSYSRIFTEIVENSLNYLYHRGSAGKAHGTAGQFHGETSPATGEDLENVGWKFRVYEAAYPLLRGFSLLDRVIPFREGYMHCARARRPSASESIDVATATHTEVR